MPAGTPNSRRGKNSSLTIILKVPGHSLAQLMLSNQGTPEIKDRSSPASSGEPPAVRPSSADNGSDDANSTPATGATPGDTPRRKAVPGPKPGNKRPNGQTDAKSRGRPGPKKKPKIDEGDKLPAAQRLGPKANTGAINAGLRALDRTGSACRKWERKPLQLRSFTGIMWQLPSWRTPGIADSKLDSDSKLLAPEFSSAVPSEKSGDGDVTPASQMVEPSSPAILAA
ncbi:unnamed protein product [Penicillium salamii]|nr:unnamed protein product [Penicillium salamii]CAG8309763.1 unnamed protein product [Penicillium salamii]